MTKNDTAWAKIFDSLSLLPKIGQHGFVYITADEIKEAGKREPRLLAKQDTEKSRPKIFKQNNLSILPVENGKYIIFKDDSLRTYYPILHLFSDIEIEEYHITRDFSEYDTIDPGIITTESQAIDFANLVSLIKTFTGETELLLTIRGRYGSKDFSIEIPPDNHSINISGVQIEIDAGFESPDKIYLFEAKSGRSEDFNIRQLFYPYKDWSCKSLKTIIPIFFVYTNGLFYFFQFAFDEGYGNLRLVRKKCFTINEPIKQRIDLSQLLRSTQIENEPAVTFPQANDLDKVIDIVTNYSSGLTNKEEIVEFFEFAGRQGDYYADAAIYLGLLKRHLDRSSEFELTRVGEFIANSQKRSQRNLWLLKQMLKTPSFNEIIRLFRDNSYNISRMNAELLAPIIQRHQIQLHGTTPGRRASTVKSWLRWMKNNMDFD